MQAIGDALSQRPSKIHFERRDSAHLAVRFIDFRRSCGAEQRKIFGRVDRQFPDAENMRATRVRSALCRSKSSAGSTTRSFT
jgi:hypothetical protein